MCTYLEAILHQLTRLTRCCSKILATSSSTLGNCLATLRLVVAVGGWGLQDNLPAEFCPMCPESLLGVFGGSQRYSSRLPRKAWQCSWRDYDNRLCSGTRYSKLSHALKYVGSALLHKGQRRLLTDTCSQKKTPTHFCFSNRARFL